MLLRTATVAALTVIITAGCAPTTPTATGLDSTPTASTASTVHIVTGLEALRISDPALYVEYDNWPDVLTAICGVLDAYGGVNDSAVLAVDATLSDVTSKQAGKMIFTAVTDYCPSLTAQMNLWLGS